MNSRTRSAKELLIFRAVVAATRWAEIKRQTEKREGSINLDDMKGILDDIEEGVSCLINTMDDATKAQIVKWVRIEEKKP